MNRSAYIFCILIFATHFVQAVEHYVFFNRDHEKIKEPQFLETTALTGAQLKYTWRELEPGPGEYDFSLIERHLQFLQEHGKKLFIQLQDTSFDMGITNVPRYLTKHPQFNGGANPQYEIPDDDEARAKPCGWVARRWDPAVQEKFHQLLFALGQKFDGKIAGINLPETSVNFGHSGKFFPKGFTPEAYRDACVTNMIALKRAFPKSVTMQYANFMPGEWLPEKNKGFLRSVYEHAQKIKVGVGGPDLLPNKWGQMQHAYPLIRESAGVVPTGISVQEGNYQHKDPRTGKQVTIADLQDFATDYLKVDYIFWCTQEPYFSGKLIPFLRGQK